MQIKFQNVYNVFIFLLKCLITLTFIHNVLVMSLCYYIATSNNEETDTYANV